MALHIHPQNQEEVTLPAVSRGVPVLNLEGFRSGSPTKRSEFIAEIGRAFRDVGFVVIEGHGIDLDLIDSAYEMSKQLFALPDEVKMKFADSSIGHQRGYTPFGKEHAKGFDIPDLKEFWHVGRENFNLTAPTNQLPPNVWPDSLPPFKPMMVELYRQFESCSELLLGATAQYLGLADDFLVNAARNGDSILRLLHYPSLNSISNQDAGIRAAPHEDINLLTILVGASDAGLEILNRNGSWIAVPSTKDQVVVNVADMLQNISNGELKSTTHRVVLPQDPSIPRYSMPFFVHPRHEVDLTPLPELIARSGEIRYSSITARGFLMQRLAEIGIV